MTGRGTLLRLAALLSATVTLSACPAVTVPDRPVVTLAATPATPQFAQGDPVTLSVVLQNVGTVDTRVSLLADGNLNIVALDRDGVPVVPRTTTIRYRDSLKTLLAGSLRILTPGERVSFDWTSIADPPHAGAALQVVHYDPEGSHRASLSDVGQAGTYRLTLVYRLGDPWDQPYDVYTGETNQATVTFIVDP